MKQYTVTWPTRPTGLYTEYAEADTPTDAVRDAAARDLPTTPGYTIAFDYEPEVWQIRTPNRLRSRRVQGPCYKDAIPGKIAFTPLPLNTDTETVR